MKLIIVFGTYKCDTEKIQVIESEDIVFRFTEEKRKNDSDNFMIIELEGECITLEIRNNFYEIEDFYSVKSAIREKILSDKSIKLIVINDILAKII